MPDNPWEMLAKSQRAAVGLMTDTVTTMVEMGKAGVTKPEDVLTQVSALAAAVGDLAGATARPLEIFLESQRQLAETMAAFAVLQRQLADVMDTAATNHAAIVQALEMMSAPVMTVAHRVRSASGPVDDEGTGGTGDDEKSPGTGTSRRTATRGARPTGTKSAKGTKG